MILLLLMTFVLLLTMLRLFNVFYHNLHDWISLLSAFVLLIIWGFFIYGTIIVQPYGVTGLVGLFLANLLSVLVYIDRCLARRASDE